MITTHKTLTAKLTAASSATDRWTVKIHSSNTEPTVEIWFIFGDKDTPTHYGYIHKDDLRALLSEE